MPGKGECGDLRFQAGGALVSRDHQKTLASLLTWRFQVLRSSKSTEALLQWDHLHHDIEMSVTLCGPKNSGEVVWLTSEHIGRLVVVVAGVGVKQ